MTTKNFIKRGIFVTMAEPALGKMNGKNIVGLVQCFQVITIKSQIKKNVTANG